MYVAGDALSASSWIVLMPSKKLHKKGGLKSNMATMSPKVKGAYRVIAQVAIRMAREQEQKVKGGSQCQIIAKTSAGYVEKGG
jgi:hypothetical protein